MQPGDRVGILSLNSDIFHEALLAIPWAGGAVVPVNFRWSPAEIAFSLDECGVAILLVDDMFLGLVDPIRELYAGLTTVIHAGDKPTPEGMLARAAPRGRSPSTTAVGAGPTSSGSSTPAAPPEPRRASR